MRVAAVFLIALLGVGVAGCNETSSEAAKRVRVDEFAATIRGVGYRDTKAAVIRRFGRHRPYSQTEGMTPVGDDWYEIGGPTSMGYPRWAKRCSRAGDEESMRYRGVTFGIACGRVYQLVISAEGAITRRGVGVGSRQEDIRRAYPRLRCLTANENSEYVEYPACSGKVGRFWVWFGKDPVRSVALSASPLP